MRRFFERRRVASHLIRFRGSDGGTKNLPSPSCFMQLANAWKHAERERELLSYSNVIIVGSFFCSSIVNFGRYSATDFALEKQGGK